MATVPPRADEDDRAQPPQMSTGSDPFLSVKRGATELYLIRHGDALPDANEVRAGSYDDQHLTDLGRRQAAALAARLRSTHFDALYSSPLERALQTAAPLAVSLGLDVNPVPDLRELDFARIGPAPPPGATPADLAVHLRAQIDQLILVAMSTGRWDGLPGIEDRAAFRARIVRAHDHVAARHPGGRIACFSHAGAINMYVAAALGMERDYFFPAANTSISIVRVKGERRVVLALNDICHLREAGLFPPAEK
jgi:broad specificity phosphatase PhoE